TSGRGSRSCSTVMSAMTSSPKACGQWATTPSLVWPDRFSQAMCNDSEGEEGESDALVAVTQLPTFQ
ncbi:unnamed protein product, partial [Closterium sp. Naga37s-1]